MKVVVPVKAYDDGGRAKGLTALVAELRERKQVVAEELKEGGGDWLALMAESKQIERRLTTTLVALHEIMQGIKKEVVLAIPRSEWPVCPCCDQKMKPEPTDEEVLSLMERMTATPSNESAGGPEDEQAARADGDQSGGPDGHDDSE